VSSAASVEGRERLRLFCALRLPDDAIERLVQWQRRAFARAAGIRVLRPEQLHVTLSFLGSRPAEELEPIAGALRDAAVKAEPPTLSVRRYRETRSVGMLVCDDEEGRATQLANDLFARLEALGVYERERRPWLPHVTIIRFRTQPRLSPRLPDLGAVMSSEAAVYMSVLRPSGAQYQVLETVGLGGR
jgi:RNA 2',3'-cyclic 3'-phosphodiesterase